MDPIRPPDSTLKDCLMAPPPPPRRLPRRRPSPHDDRVVITWDDEPDTTTTTTITTTATTATTTTAYDEEAQLRKAMEESLREEQERQELENHRQKYSAVVSRLRWMRHPTDLVVDEWIQRIETPSSPLDEDTHDRLSTWLEKRRRNSPFLGVLEDLLKK